MNTTAGNATALPTSKLYSCPDWDRIRAGVVIIWAVSMICFSTATFVWGQQALAYKLRKMNDMDKVKQELKNVGPLW